MIDIKEISDYCNEFQITKINLLNDNNLYKIESYFIDRYKDDYFIENNEVCSEELIDKFKFNFVNTLKLYLGDELFYINKTLIYFNSLILPEQRTPKWYDDRKKRITGSEAGSIITSMKYVSDDIIKNESLQNTLFQKIGIATPSFNGGAAIMHGVLCEEITTRLYEQRFNVVVKEYGCLPHKTINFLGASPDGIVIKSKNNDFSSKNYITSTFKIGTMLEIKNPYSRKINGKIKPDYLNQIHLQLQTTGLFLCDFIETDINKEAYVTIDELIDDKFVIENEDDFNLIENHNIPISSLSSNGKEKGVMLHFQKKDPIRDSNISIVYPVNKNITKNEVNKWIEKQKKLFKKKKYEYIRPYFWKIKQFSIISVKKDNNYWNTKMFPKLKSFWDIVEKHKKKDNETLKRLYSNLSDDVNGENIMDVKTKIYRKRKLRKYKIEKKNPEYEELSFNYESFKFSDE